jgi:uncharacterized Tic20 family protein
MSEPFGHRLSSEPSAPVTNPVPPAPQYPAAENDHLLVEPPSAVYPATPPAPLPSMTGAQERNWAVGAHLSGFVAAYLALGFIGPLVVMLTGGSRSAYVRRHAVEALNFNLSVLIYLAVSGVLAIVLIGLPMLVAVGILYVVASIRGAMAASRGEQYRYPLSFRFVS